MAIDDTISDGMLFEKIVGKKSCNGNYPGDVPDFKINLKQIDKTYLLIKKMQRVYHSDPTYAVSKYYAESFNNVEEAYLSKNLDAFKRAVKDLMMDIDAK
ncbi:MAG: hypothetical protein ACP5N1_05655 [Candidatus Woesearchaeota archaeon]